MQRLKDEPPPPPDQAWFKRLIAIAILYRSVEKKIKSMKFPAYGAQITGYVVSGLSHRAGGRIDFNGLWSKQMISPELEQLIAEWALRLDEIMRKSAGPRNPSEWFKKADCWKEIHAHLPALTDPLPPELSYVKSDGKGDGKVTVLPPTGRHTIADYERIERCMQIPSAVWMEIAERGQKTGAIHWKVAGICRTLAGYAAGGWEKKPSARQAKPALEAVLAAEQAGLVNAGISAQIAEGDQG
ncbi:AIPR family protein [Methylovirgula sp. HY1]|uniref:AIPR family protein n=1 Tax=Methylovirgula sp. HY1 TaxID=2822761 RepID=UPI0021062108|nr:AIPR family protein [Methylovirgula sp. HY1]